MVCTSCAGLEFMYRSDICPYCKGRYDTCPECNGSGKILIYAICGRCVPLGGRPTRIHNSGRNGNALLYFTKEDNLSIVRNIIDRDPILMCINGIYGSLFFDAIVHNSMNVAKFLIERGVNINMANSYGLTPLKFIMDMNDSKYDPMIELLILNGAR